MGANSWFCEAETFSRPLRPVHRSKRASQQLAQPVKTWLLPMLDLKVSERTPADFGCGNPNKR
jgi:hypothetical protein